MAPAVTDAFGVTHMRVLRRIEPDIGVSQVSGRMFPIIVAAGGTFSDTRSLQPTIERLRPTTNANRGRTKAQ